MFYVVVLFFIFYVFMFYVMIYYLYFKEKMVSVEQIILWEMVKMVVLINVFVNFVMYYWKMWEL